MNSFDEIRLLYRPYANEVYKIMIGITSLEYEKLMTLSMTKEIYENICPFGITLDKFDMPILCAGGTIVKVKITD